MDCDLFEARDVAVRAAEAAGALVRGRLFRHFDVHEKGTGGDVVTDVDIATEQLIIQTIREVFPRHRLVSEEMGTLDGNGSWTWLIDPVDGTNNLVIGLPVLAVGLALCHDGVPVVSAVHDPISRRTWSAVHGHGAWTSGNQLMRVPRSSGRRKPVLAWSQGYDVSNDDSTARALKMVLTHGAQRVLDLWAPLTCWMMLARGDVDGVIGYRIREIDLHAGALIAAEAGLLIQDFAGAPYPLRVRGAIDQSLVAGSPELVSDLTQAVPAARRLAKNVGELVVTGFRDDS
ncbi:inositol monophosphatase family protein [Streptomyces sp. NPDC019990]|uniref:inositol monophosphatase family protein n=1 Tax=Streptomyces sp. NPDC019990 TaxID=3154693 RepID=UPI0033F64379